MIQRIYVGMHVWITRHTSDINHQGLCDNELMLGDLHQPNLHKPINTLRLRPNGYNFADNSFSCMKIIVFWLWFHWNLFQRVQLTIIQHWFRFGLATNTRQAITWTHDGLVYRRIYGSFSADEQNSAHQLWFTSMKVLFLTKKFHKVGSIWRLSCEWNGCRFMSCTKLPLSLAMYSYHFPNLFHNF